MEYKQNLDYKTKKMLATLIRIDTVLYFSLLLSIAIFVVLLLFIKAE